MDKPIEDTGPPRSSIQRVYLALRKDIITGRIPPGERLKIDALKVALETGASPVREALSLLTSNQLVDRLDQRGFRVTATSRAQFQEILKLRCNLEELALRDSLANTDPAWEDALVLAYHRMSRSDRNDLETYEPHHKHFHMTLLSACDSPILLRFCSQLYDLNVRYRYLASSSESYSNRDVEAEHLAIFDAAVNRDTASACASLTAHYHKTGAFLAEKID